jgi:hypothetical protein
MGTNPDARGTSPDVERAPAPFQLAIRNLTELFVADSDNKFSICSKVD